MASREDRGKRFAPAIPRVLSILAILTLALICWVPSATAVPFPQERDAALQEHGAAARTAAAGEHSEEAGHPEETGHAAEEESPFETLYKHVVPHQLGPHTPLDLFGIPVMSFEEEVTLFGVPVYNIQIYQILAVLLIFLLFARVPAKIRAARKPTILGSFVQWIRDEMIYPVMGKDMGDRFAPFFVTVFFFILLQNLLGLIPGGLTATASIFVTAAMALVTLFCMMFFGMKEQGLFKYWKNLLPPGIPSAMIPLMFVVELIGVFVKPFALTIRLFANMTAGHLVVLSFMGLIFYFGQSVSPAVGYATSPVWIGFAVFIMIIEGFVALLQAYIFTLLSIIFVGASVHPEH